jgi:hypothetical protein
MSDTTIAAELRRLVADRARHCCEYCWTQAYYSSAPFAIDHIKPRILDGPTIADNLAFSCYGCNQHKGRRVSARDPVTNSLAPLFHPRVDAWDEHFAWSDDLTLIIGLTPTGRASISALQLNRKGLVNIRRVLRAIGEHPPHPNPRS